MELKESDTLTQEPMFLKTFVKTTVQTETVETQEMAVQTEVEAAETHEMGVQTQDQNIEMQGVSVHTEEYEEMEYILYV